MPATGSAFSTADGRSSANTVAPRLASSLAVAPPSPDAPPVTMAEVLLISMPQRVTGLGYPLARRFDRLRAKCSSTTSGTAASRASRTKSMFAPQAPLSQHGEAEDLHTIDPGHDCARGTSASRALIDPDRGTRESRSAI